MPFTIETDIQKLAGKNSGDPIVSSDWNALVLAIVNSWGLSGNNARAAIQLPDELANRNDILDAIDPDDKFLGTIDDEPLDIRVNNKTAIFIKPGGNVGIGTTTPDYPLHVEREADLLVGLRNTDGVNGYGLLVDAGGTAVRRYVARFRNAAKEDVMFVGANGNVGIGTTSPNATLQVGAAGGDPQIGSQLQVLGANGNYNGMGNVYIQATDWGKDKGGMLSFGGQRLTSLASAVPWAVIQGAKENDANGNYASYMSFGTRQHEGNITERMRINSSGNVGIGTTSPEAKLNIVSGSQNALQINVDDTTTRDIFFREDSDQSGALIRYDALNNNLQLIARESGVDQIGLSLNRNTGNVGIGTTSPGAKLEVDGDVKISGNLEVKGDVEYLKPQHQKTGDLIIEEGKVGIGTTSPTRSLDVRGNVYIESSTKPILLTLSDGSSDPFVFTKTGRLGIGTTTPGAKLEVEGPTGVVELGGSAVGSAAIFARSDANHTGELLQLVDETGERFVVRNNGNVGIGTKEAAVYGEKLTVLGNNAWNTMFTDGTRYVGICTDWGPDAPGIGTRSNHNFQILVNDSPKMYFKANGNIGIGTTDPQEKLHITRGNILFEDTHAAAGNRKFRIYHNDQYLTFQQLTDAGSVERTVMRFDQKGNVGIGTNSTKILNSGVYSTLYVNGSRLSVEGAEADFDLIDTDGAANDRWLNLVVNGGVGKFASLQDNGAAWVADNILVMDLGTGNVGIGTKSPRQKLDVAGAILSTVGYLADDNTSTNRYLIRYSGQNNDILLGDPVLSSNVGIGTTRPYAKLNIGNETRGIGTSGNSLRVLDNAAGWLSVFANYNPIGGGVLIGHADSGSNPVDLFAVYSGVVQDPFRTPRFEVKSNGDVWAFKRTAGGNDYAEYFESLNGKEIDSGVSVVFENGKIRFAKNNESPIGIISANPIIIGGVHPEWPKKYLRDEFGNEVMEEYQEEIMVPNKEKVKKQRQKVEKKTIKEKVTRTEVVYKNKKYRQVEITETVSREVEEPIFEEVDLYDEKDKIIGKHQVPVMEAYQEEIEVLDDDGKPVMVGTGKFETKERPKLNPGYDEKNEYVSREKRPEWNCVGLLGQIPLRKGQPVAPGWVKIKDLSDKVELWLVK